MIHTTIGLYPNGEYKVNGVPTSDLDLHVEYNKTMRGGRALFVDGICVYTGSMTEDECGTFIKKHSDIIMTKDTAPYH